jgi:hypothetical protein
MQIQYTTEDGRISVTGNAESVKGAFAAVAQVQEIFEGNKCGQCGSPSNLETRNYDGNTYYNKRCRNADCGAQLDFGQHKEGGTLFVKRRDKDGNAIGVDGWYQWQKKEKSSASSGFDDSPSQEEDGNVPF